MPAHKTFKPVPRPTELKVEHFLKNNRFSDLSQREKKAASDAREPTGRPAAPPRSPATTTTTKSDKPLRSLLREPAGQPAAPQASRSKKLEDEFDAVVDADIRECENEADQLLACAPEEMTVLVAADTGAVDHVIPVGALPRGCVLTASWNATLSAQTKRISKPTADATL